MTNPIYDLYSPSRHEQTHREVERLEAEIEQVKRDRDYLHERLNEQLARVDQQLARAATAEDEVERLRAFVQKVALYSNDAWLAREADELAPGASL